MIQILPDFLEMSFFFFFVPGSSPEFYSVFSCVLLVSYSSEIFNISLCYMTSILLKSTGQVFCSTSLVWDFLMIRLRFWTWEKDTTETMCSFSASYHDDHVSASFLPWKFPLESKGFFCVIYTYLGDTWMLCKYPT